MVFRISMTISRSWREVVVELIRLPLALYNKYNVNLPQTIIVLSIYLSNLVA